MQRRFLSLVKIMVGTRLEIVFIEGSMSITLPPLPYAPEALEPHLSWRTPVAHRGHHHAAYVAKTYALIQRTPLESADLQHPRRVQQSIEGDRDGHT
jgi:superoxide dismutase